MGLFITALWLLFDALYWIQEYLKAMNLGEKPPLKFTKDDIISAEAVDG